MPRQLKPKMKRIHVNRQVLAGNVRHGRNDPPLTCKTYDSNLKGHRVDILDSEGSVVASLVYPGKQLPCGARVWLETRLDVRVSGMEAYEPT
jgi:hypothetical protein